MARFVQRRRQRQYRALCENIRRHDVVLHAMGEQATPMAEVEFVEASRRNLESKRQRLALKLLPTDPKEF